MAIIQTFGLLPAADQRRRAPAVPQLFDDECRALFERRFARDIAAFDYRY